MPIRPLRASQSRTASLISISCRARIARASAQVLLSATVGPEAISDSELAALASEVVGKSIHYVDLEMIHLELGRGVDRFEIESELHELLFFHRLLVNHVTRVILIVNGKKLTYGNILFCN